MNSLPSYIEGIGTDWHNLSHHGKDPEKIAELALVEKAKLRRFSKDPRPQDVALSVGPLEGGLKWQVD